MQLLAKGVVLFGLIYFGALAYVAVNTEKQCLLRGAPRYHVTWDFNQFCTIRVDQTDFTYQLPER